MEERSTWPGCDRDATEKSLKLARGQERIFSGFGPAPAGPSTYSHSARQEAEKAWTQFKVNLRQVERGIVDPPSVGAEAGVYTVSGGKLAGRPYETARTARGRDSPFGPPPAQIWTCGAAITGDPLVNDLKTWLDAALVAALPKPALAAVIRYVTNHWEAFIRYIEDGRLSLDNNRPKRTLRLRPTTAHLFCSSVFMSIEACVCGGWCLLPDPNPSCWGVAPRFAAFVSGALHMLKLLPVVLFGLVSATLVRADGAQDGAVAFAVKLGGKITRDEKLPGKPVVKVELFFSGVTDAGLRELVVFKDLTYFDSRVTQVSDAGLKELAPLRNVTCLDLRLTKVTDAGLRELDVFKNLAKLDLIGTEVTDAGVTELAALKNLTTLNLGLTKVTNVGLRLLPGLKNLTSLDLSSTEVTDAGVAEIPSPQQPPHDRAN